MNWQTPSEPRTNWLPPLAFRAATPADADAIDYLFFVHDRHDGNAEAARFAAALTDALAGQGYRVSGSAPVTAVFGSVVPVTSVPSAITVTPVGVPGAVVFGATVVAGTLVPPPSVAVTLTVWPSV